MLCKRCGHSADSHDIGGGCRRLGCNCFGFVGPGDAYEYTTLSSPLYKPVGERTVGQSMIALDLSNKIRELIATDIQVESKGADRAVVYMPFIYDDGDHLSIYVANANGRWELSDEGDVFKRADDIGLDFSKQENAARLHNLIEFYGVSEDNGTLNITADDELLTDAIFTLTQTCLEATWLAKPHPEQTMSEDNEPDYNLERVQRRLVQQALELHGGNRTHAAKALGISVRSLQRKVKQYGLPALDCCGKER